MREDVKSSQQPSKNYIRYATRQKRADTKKALKNLLFNSGSSKNFFQNIQNENDSGSSPQKHRSRSSRHAEKSHHKKTKRKFKRESFSEDDDNNPESIFRATFGKRWYTWSFDSCRNSSFKDSESGFEWTEQSSWKDKSKRWENSSDVESDDESCTIGSYSDRTILDLPPTVLFKHMTPSGSFHLSALKWHPDKHEGPSQRIMAVYPPPCAEFDPLSGRLEQWLQRNLNFVLMLTNLCAMHYPQRKLGSKGSGLNINSSLYTGSLFKRNPHTDLT
ncbi:Chaperone DnaJ-domain superfamily protein [Prunus dulcis]|uniref:Chaperone DnaJ-domain superfamily protein n=1 Tax=Prunus dulcis TaxID=3755 RepID=A0A4Y1RMH5_PRUDU|nr:Chaperone DnaJ-domain superfamily protein [Prunus dulcis]